MTASLSLGRYDVIVVGAGSAGLPTAYFAARRGARVLLLDADRQIGGTMQISSGQMSAAGTALQKSKGIADSAEEHFADILRISRGTVNAALVRLAVTHAGATFDWLMENGLDVLPEHPVLGQAHEPYTKPRYAWGARMGRSIIAVIEPLLQAEIARGAVDLRLNHEVTALLQEEDGAIVGVEAHDGEGRLAAFHGDSVVLTAGGYMGNPTMFEAVNGVPQFYMGANPKNRGIVHQIVETVGGYMRGGELYLSNFGNILDSENYPAGLAARINHFPEVRPPWEIYVNVHGQRFVREDMPSVDAREQSLRVQPGLRYWAVFDQMIFDAAPPLLTVMTPEEVRTAFNARPFFHRADTLHELARLAGVDAHGLADTVRLYNYGVQTGNDLLGRRHLPRAIETPPFYAIRAQGTSISSTAGIAVDDRLRVIRHDGTPIPNLYAAGEILGTAQTMGQSVCGGMNVTPALTFGRLLGAEMLPIRADRETV
jgi:fumarate reductase flavoprotein subunit